MGKHDAVCTNARGVDLSSPVMALAWLFSSSCTFRNLSFWPRHQILDPYMATEVTAATPTLHIRLTDKPPLLMLRLDTRCRATLALAILFSKCVWVCVSSDRKVTLMYYEGCVGEERSEGTFPAEVTVAQDIG